MPGGGYEGPPLATSVLLDGDFVAVANKTEKGLEQWIGHPRRAGTAARKWSECNPFWESLRRKPERRESLRLGPPRRSETGFTGDHAAFRGA